jgi:hypothetical protein
MQTKTKTAEPQDNEGGNVHFLQPLKEIPDPNVPLLKEGRGVYEQWCRTLIKSGLLTLKSREYVELLAIATDDIAYTINKGKRPTRQAMEAKRAAMMKLEKLDTSDTLMTATGGENTYAKFGFAKRAKKARFGE